jgi:hypothetical protein
MRLLLFCARVPSAIFDRVEQQTFNFVLCVLYDENFRQAQQIFTFP